MTDEEIVDLLEILRQNRLAIKAMEDENKAIQKVLLENLSTDYAYDEGDQRYIARLVTTNTETVNLEKLAAVAPGLLNEITERKLKKSLLDESIDKGLWTPELYESVVHTDVRQYLKIEPITVAEDEEER